MMRMLNIPIPILAGMASVQFPDGVMEGAPGWFMGFATAVFVFAYILKATGRMPRKNGSERRSGDFTDGDRACQVEIAAATKKVADLLAERDDGGFERFLKLNETVVDDHKLLAKLVELQEQQTAHMAVLATDIRRRA